MLLNLLNLYSLIFALFSKIDGMGRELNALKPTLCMNASTIPESALNMTEALALSCLEVSISCTSCNVPLTISANTTTINVVNAIRSAKAFESQIQAHVTTAVPTKLSPFTTNSIENIKMKILSPHNLIEKEDEIETTTVSVIELMRKEMEKLNQMFPSSNETSSEANDSGEIFYEYTDVNTADSSFEFETNTDSEVANDTFYSSTLNLDPIYSTVSEENTSSSNDYTSIRSTSDSDDSTMSVTYTYSSPIFGFSSHNSSSVTTDSTIISRDTSSMETVISPATTLQYSTNTNLGTETEQYMFTDDDLKMSTNYPDEFTTELSTSSSIIYICPSITFNCTISCGGQNVTQVVLITDCTKVEKRCYVRQCKLSKLKQNIAIDYVYEDEHKRKMYNLTTETKKKLLKLCWETMFGQELVKLTMMDLVSLKSII